MSLLGSYIDSVIDDPDPDVLPGVERLLRMHASAARNWRSLIELEVAFVSGHLQEDDEGTDDLWYDSLEDLQRYEKRAKGALHMGEEKSAVLERRWLAENASNLPNVEWVQVKELYQRTIDTAESAGLRERSVPLRISLTTAAIQHEVSKAEISSLWESMMDSWQGEQRKSHFIRFATLAEEAVESPIIGWGMVRELCQKIVSCEADGSVARVYWEFAELAEKSDEASSKDTIELYARAIRAFKSLSDSFLCNSVPKEGQIDIIGQVVQVEQDLLLDWEETKLLYRGAIRYTNPNGALSFRSVQEGEGFTVEYTPLSGLSDEDLPSDMTKEHVMKFLTASSDWTRMKDAQTHLADRRNSAKEQLANRYCPSGTKKELIQLLVRECGAGTLSGGFRAKELAELVECSEGHARQIAFRNPAEEVRGSERESVLENEEGERKKNQCAACGAESSLQIHHIIPMSDGGTKDMENLAALCRSCHREAHSGTWGPIIYDTVDEFWDWVKTHPLK